MDYYQIGGHGSHTHWFGYETSKLSDFVFSALSARTGENGEDKKKASIELVLGILNTGASHLLASEVQMNAMLRYAGRTHGVRIRRPNSPRHASLYASLSPIVFHSPGELKSKLKTYVRNPKSGKQAGRDTSKANKMYDQLNLSRAAFEHQRVLWSAIQSPIDFKKFALCELPIWIASTSFVALTLQTWRFDPIEKRRTDPTVLSLELACVNCIAFEREDYVNKLSHAISVKIEEHAAMTNGPNTSSSANTRQEMVKKAELSRRLNEFFSSIDSKQALLLVYDAEQTRNSLQKLGIDVSSYQDGIATLLYGQNWQQGDRLDSSRDQSQGYRGSYHSRGTHSSWTNPRGRSRSPLRGLSYAERPRSPPSRVHNNQRPLPTQENQEAGDEGEGEDEEDEDEDEDATPPPAKVYIIDVKALFLAVSRFEPRAVSNLRDLAGKLGIQGGPGGSYDSNECRLLIEAWKCMASGKAIDEQHDELWSAKAVLSRRSEPENDASTSRVGQGQADVPPVANDDEDPDPNDIVPNRRPSQIAVAGGLRPPTDDYDSDDSEY